MTTSNGSRSASSEVRQLVGVGLDEAEAGMALGGQAHHLAREVDADAGRGRPSAASRSPVPQPISSTRGARGDEEAVDALEAAVVGAGEAGRRPQRRATASQWAARSRR